MNPLFGGILPGTFCGLTVHEVPDWPTVPLQVGHRVRSAHPLVVRLACWVRRWGGSLSPWVWFPLIDQVPGPPLVDPLGGRLFCSAAQAAELRRRTQIACVPSRPLAGVINGVGP